MIGFPKDLNSRQDIEHLLAMPEHAAKVKEALGQLLAARFVWVAAGELAAEDPEKEDTTHKVVVEEREGLPVRLHWAQMEDPKAKIFRLGLTVAEAEALIQEGGHD